MSAEPDSLLTAMVQFEIWLKSKPADLMFESAPQPVDFTNENQTGRKSAKLKLYGSSSLEEQAGGTCRH